ncbi:MAG TPA: hypothetical protein VF954_00405, partial [Acidimicrobiales bacterium]
GMREPLPLYCKTSAAYAAARLTGMGADVTDAARREWEVGLFGEQLDAEHQLVYDGLRSLDEVEEEQPPGTETGDGWDPGEATRFGRLACRMWSDVLAREKVAVDG